MSFLSIQIQAQTNINLKLKNQIDSIGFVDQKYREMLDNIDNSAFSDSISKIYKVKSEEVETAIWDMTQKVDSSNLVFIEGVITKFGYPGKTLVGDSSCEVAWLVIQHSNIKTMSKYLDLLKNAAIRNELPSFCAAMTEDRYLMCMRKEQIYGTQATVRNLKNGMKENIIWPIYDPINVNKRRKEAGFTTTVEESAKALNIKYRVVQLNEIDWTH